MSGYPGFELKRLAHTKLAKEYKMLAKDHSPYRNRALEKTVEERDAAKKELVARIEQVAQLSADLRGYREGARETTNHINRLQDQNRRLVEAVNVLASLIDDSGALIRPSIKEVNQARDLLRSLGEKV